MLNTVEEALQDVAAGKMIIIVDDENREAEGDLVCAAELCTPEIINFMVTHARGLVCTALTATRIEELNLPMMVQTNTSQFETAFTVSVEARKDTTTGISAADRSITSRRLADLNFVAKDFVTPGHTFPLKARDGGVLVRAGHTEAAVDVSRLVGLNPSGVICEIMNEDGTMARLPELKVLAKEWDLKIISVEDLIAYRRQTEKLVERIFEQQATSRFGDFKVIAFEDTISGREHLAFVKGEIHPEEPVLVRVQIDNVLADAFGILGKQSMDTFVEGIERIQKEGGVFLYLRPGGGQKKLWEKLWEEGVSEQDSETFTFKHDNRRLGIGNQILFELGVRKIKLLSNHEAPKTGLKGFELEIVEVLKP